MKRTQSFMRLVFKLEFELILKKRAPVLLLLLLLFESSPPRSKVSVTVPESSLSHYSDL